MHRPSLSRELSHSHPRTATYGLLQPECNHLEFGQRRRAYTASLDVGTYYTLSSTTGTVASNGSALITVTPHLPATGATFPGTGSTPYDDRLRIVVGGNTYVVPVSLTVTGTVLSSSLTSQNGFFGGNNFYVYSSQGPTLNVTNSGNLSANVIPSFNGYPGFYANPASGTAPAGGFFSTQLRFNGSGCWVYTDVSATAPGSHVCQTNSAIAIQGCN